MKWEKPVLVSLQERDNVTGTTSFNEALVKSASSQYGGVGFTAGGSYTITQAQIPLFRVGGATLTYNLFAAIFSDNGSNSPNALLAGSSPSLGVAAQSLPGSESTLIIFNSMSANLVNGTKYWFVVYGDAAGPQDAVNYCEWPAISAGASNIYVTSPSPGNSWSQADSFVNMKYALYGP